MARQYQKMKELLPEIKRMLATGKTQREVARYFGLDADRPIHDLLKRERRKERNGIVPVRRSRPRKRPLSTQQEYERRVKELEREVALLRSFLHAAGRM